MQQLLLTGTVLASIAAPAHAQPDHIISMSKVGTPACTSPTEEAKAYQDLLMGHWPNLNTCLLLGDGEKVELLQVYKNGLAKIEASMGAPGLSATFFVRSELLRDYQARIRASQERVDPRYKAQAEKQEAAWRDAEEKARGCDRMTGWRPMTAYLIERTLDDIRALVCLPSGPAGQIELIA